MSAKYWALAQVAGGGVNGTRVYWSDSAGANTLVRATSVTGWNVGTLAGNRWADLSNGTEVGRATFGTIDLPNNTAPTVDTSYTIGALSGFANPNILSSTDSISTLYTYNGVFPAGTWTWNFPVRAVTLANGDGGVDMRVFKAKRAGGSFGSIVELTSATIRGSNVTNLTTTVDQTTVLTWSAPTIILNDEFIICKMAWRIPAGQAGSGNNSDVALRYGEGCNMISPNIRQRRLTVT